MPDINVQRALAHSQAQRLHLPLLFVECKPNSNVHISQDDSKMHLKLVSDQKFILMDENNLLKCMGLTETNAKELKTLFSEEVNEFLKNTTYCNYSSPPP